MRATELLWPPPIPVLTPHLLESSPGGVTAGGRQSSPLKLLASAGRGFCLPVVFILGSN